MKKVSKNYYVHRSDFTSLLPLMDSYEKMSLLSWGISYLYTYGFAWDVCKYNFHSETFTFIHCPTWDTLYEPIVGEQYLFKEYGESPILKEGGKQVYHQKHLFVADDYEGFDIQISEERTALLEIIPWYRENKSKIGNRIVWEDFLSAYNLPRIMP